MAIRKVNGAGLQHIIWLFARLYITLLMVTAALSLSLIHIYPLKITKVVPEVKDRMFDVDLVFTDDMPDNVRVGKSFRVQIELGQPDVYKRQ